MKIHKEKEKFIMELKLFNLVCIMALITFFAALSLVAGYSYGKVEVYEAIYANQLNVNINPVALEALK